MARKIVIGAIAFIVVLVIIDRLGVGGGPTPATEVAFIPPPGASAPAPSDDLATAAYRVLVDRQYGHLSKSTQRFSQLAADPQFTNAEWTFAVGQELAVWRLVAEQALLLEPPSGYEQSHAEHLAGADHFTAAADVADQAMVSRDPKQIAAAEAQVRQGTRRLEAAEGLRPDHPIDYPPLDRLVDRELAKQQKKGEGR